MNYIRSFFLLVKMDDFINVTKKDPQVLIIIKDMLDKYNRLH